MLSDQIFGIAIHNYVSPQCGTLHCQCASRANTTQTSSHVRYTVALQIRTTVANTLVAQDHHILGNHHINLQVLVT